jgi:hypothetical protein
MWVTSYGEETRGYRDGERVERGEGRGKDRGSLEVNEGELYVLEGG